jgi:hypothetical protein
VLTGMLRESESDRAARGEQIESLTAMLRSITADMTALFSRLGFRWLTKITNWPEVKKLAKYVGISGE